MFTQKSMFIDIENANSFLSSPTIQLHVGDENVQTFHIHKDLLVSRSPFFAKALRGYKDRAASNSSTAPAEVIQWKEGEEGAIELPDDDPAVFEAYIQLLYYNQIPMRSGAPDPVFPATLSPEQLAGAQSDFWAEERGKVNGDYVLISRLYVLAEKVGDVTAKQTLLRAFVESVWTMRFRGVQCFPTALDIRTLYGGTVAGDPMREFLTDCYVLVGSKEWVGTSAAPFPRDFLFDVVSGLFEVRPRPADASKIKNADVYIEKLKDKAD